MSAMADKHVRVSTEIARDPDTLYDLVSELSDMGKWSPEAQGGTWVGGATGPALGSRFRGHNRKGWRRWSTSAEVTAADRGKRFAFRVTLGPLPIAEWSYDFEAAGTQTQVVESWDDLRPSWLRTMDPVVMGIADHAEHNRKNMEATLAALKISAEAK